MITKNKFAKICALLNQEPTPRDIFYLCLFIILITFYPFYLHGRINTYELELYLPGINDIFHGAVPYRDFFYLRGPFELYMPAFLMVFLGKKISVLAVYFYAGTVLTFLLTLLIAKEFFRVRYILYLFVPVMVARTFPRVVFTYWGGMRYALGLWAVYCLVKYFTARSSGRLFNAGILTALSLLTSIEVGLSALLASLAALHFAYHFGFENKKDVWAGTKKYFQGLAIIAGPYLLYLILTGALVPFIDCVFTVTTRLTTVISPDVLNHNPRGLAEIFSGLVNPAVQNFRYLTPIYLYLIVAGWLVEQRVRNRQLAAEYFALIAVAVYGGFLYLSVFRGFGGAQFEMALQPEKILLFFFFGETYLFLLKKKRQAQQEDGSYNAFVRNCVYFLFLILFLSSICYSVARFNRRFFAFQFVRNIFTFKGIGSLRPLAKDEGRYLQLQRGGKMFAPPGQAAELEAVVYVLSLQTKPGEAVLMYPEGGIYNFLADRPHVGRFPVTTLSWLNDQWYDEFKKDFQQKMPRYVVLQKFLQKEKYDIFFAYPENKRKYEEILNLIKKYYVVKHITPESYILRLKEEGLVGPDVPDPIVTE